VVLEGAGVGRHGRKDIVLQRFFLFGVSAVSAISFRDTILAEMVVWSWRHRVGCF
jgi:hypothetical protein